MKRGREEQRTCAVCRTAGSFVIPEPERGPPDLDLRPRGEGRSSFRNLIQTCARCGYSAPTVDRRLDRAAEILQSPELRERISDPLIPADARRFVAAALLQEANKDVAGAGQSWIYAAWAADDAQALEAAKRARRRAVDCLRLARTSGRAELLPGEEQRVIADLLRRLGDFDGARAACQEGLLLSQDPEQVRVLELLLRLIGKQDTAPHSADEAADVIEGPSTAAPFAGEDTTNPTIDELNLGRGAPIGIATAIDQDRVNVQLSGEARVRRASDLVLDSGDGALIRVRVESVPAEGRAIAAVVRGSLAGAGPWMVYPP
ncbi:MAG: hypothetical protein U1E65_10585 [Myxococcota bacterium]